ncbi:MAG: nucleotide exchange factor GrpE [Elusimicrobiota bacterium]|jgi:molecular chaperone GrpE|nr:nucleotide exchange factor GrpE [Elusimicrobiota bacterium]
MSKEKEEVEKNEKQDGQDKAENLNGASKDAAAAEPKNEVEKLKLALLAKENEVKDYYEQIIRLKAEFENFRKRSDKEKREFLDYGKEKILLKQIAIDDVLTQAIKSAKNGGKLADIIIGLDMVSHEFTKMLKEEGVEEIEAKTFDPKTCDALDYKESSQPEGTVLEVCQKGYKMNGRVIRYAKVIVAKAKTKGETESEANAEKPQTQEDVKSGQNEDGVKKKSAQECASAQNNTSAQPQEALEKDLR